MKVIASTQLWMSRIDFTAPHTHQHIQARIRQCAETTGISVVGYAQESSLTLLRWPDLREGYHEPTTIECEQVTQILAISLGGVTTGVHLAEDVIHTMMGRRIGGYDTDVDASLEDVTKHAPNLTIADGYMVSARMHDDEVEEYGESVAVLTGSQCYEPEIHAVGDALQQHHYVIERGTKQRTDFYETKWASVEALSLSNEGV